MRLWPNSLKRRTILLTLLGLVAIGGTVVVVWQREIGGYVAHHLQLLRDRDNPHPVIRGLARGEIRAGSSVEELIAAHPPRRVTRLGRFTDVSYSNGPTLTAVDGKLVFASVGWCSHSTIYFNTFTEDDSREYEALLNAEYARWVEDAKTSHGAVAGVMGWMSHQPAYRDALIEPAPEP